jgi:hypothetical protein
MLWTGSNNWSALGNWTNLSAGGYGPPGLSNDVVFGNSGTVDASNLVNSIVDSDTTINSLVFTNLNGYHTIQIKPGRTLTVIGTAPGYQNSPALNVGLEGYAATNQFIRAAIMGTAGTLAISNVSANIQVRVGFSNNVVGPLAVLDLSSLGTFSATINHIQLGVESGTPRQVAGVLYLARTNHLTLTQSDNVNSMLTGGNPALYLGHNTHSGDTNGSALYLGITNGLFVNFIIIGRGNQTNNLFAFNPALLSNHPTAYIRASDGVGRVGIWTVGDNSAGGLTGPSSGTNDFIGGAVDARIDLLFLGRGRVGNTVNTGIGTLAFDDGTIDVNTLRLGTMVDEASSTNTSGVGIASVNGSATLIVNNSLEFAHINNVAIPTAAATAGTLGTLNINGGAVQAANIFGGGGLGTLNLNSGILDVKGGSIVNLTNVNIGLPGLSFPALLTNASFISTPNPIVLASNGIIAGSTGISSPRLVVNGSLSPAGVSSGTLTQDGALIFGAGGRYVWDLQNAIGQPGTDWDLIGVNAGADVQSTSSNPFVIQVRSLSDTGPGPMLSFDSATPQNWVIASLAAGFTNFTPARFIVDSSSFLNDTGGGAFRVQTNGASLLVSFVPQPSISGLSVAGATFSIISANGAPNSTYYVLGSTNLTLPLSSWFRVATNTFDVNGTGSFTGSVDQNVAQQFFMLQIP